MKRKKKMLNPLHHHRHLLQRKTSTMVQMMWRTYLTKILQGSLQALLILLLTLKTTIRVGMKSMSLRWQSLTPLSIKSPLKMTKINHRIKIIHTKMKKKKSQMMKKMKKKKKRKKRLIHQNNNNSMTSTSFM